MIITPHTKIAALLKQHPDALEAIISISPKFSKLRNPVLRKLMAGRTSIAMAATLGGCSIEDFFKPLQTLGFQMETITTTEPAEKKPVPDFFKNIQPGKITELDVRPVLASGKDPLTLILQQVKALEAGHVLKIINSFEPAPLIHLLGKQGFESYTEKISTDLIHTYFHKQGTTPLTAGLATAGSATGWDEIFTRFEGKLETVDVRNLEMPQPMHIILDALETLPKDKALFVHHKRIPVFLLPELDAQQFSYRIKELSSSEVQLLIYKD